MASTDPESRRCPKCGASLDRREARCWLCDFSFFGAANPPPRFAAAIPPSPYQFSLESLFLITTLTAVCLGVLVALPPLGVFVTLFAAAAAIRTSIECQRRSLAGEQINLSAKLDSFTGSCGIVMLALIAALFVLVAAGTLTGCLVAIVGWLRMDVLGECLMVCFSTAGTLFTIVASLYSFYFVCGAGLPPARLSVIAPALRRPKL